MISINRNTLRCAAMLLAVLPLAGLAQKSKKRKEDAWIEQSNSYIQPLLKLDKEYYPEYGSMEGEAAYDTLICVPTFINYSKYNLQRRICVDSLEKLMAAEQNPHIKQDLAIVIKKTRLYLKEVDYEENKTVSFNNPTLEIYRGIKALLDDQTPAERRPAAVIRLKKYTGEMGGRSMAAIYQNRTQIQMKNAYAVYPSKQKMETDLARNASIVKGIGDLFKKYQLTGWENSYQFLTRQLTDYDNFLRGKVLPNARVDYKLPAEDYALKLEECGVDIAPADLAVMAHAAFTDIQKEMQEIAVQVAQKYGLTSNDYRDVIRYLKTKQIVGDSIIPVYEQHLKAIEDIIRKERLVTLPDRPAMIKLATAAESAQTPAPHMQPPPFLNNTGQRGVFVLPLNMPPSPGEDKEDKYDDFTYEAACWTLIAHEARPGHELQFDKMVEEGVSLARAIYAFNSTNAEGWGLYSEYITRPFMPLEGQLVSLDYRLLRAARAFLDPELQAGKVTQEQAMNLLMKDVVLSHAFAKEEVERYTIGMPGQANSYFYGFTKMLALRKDAEAALGSKFDARRFHDFILFQGLLPPALLRDAVMNTFVPDGGK